MAKLGITLGDVKLLVGAGRLVGDARFVCHEVRRLDQAEANHLSFVKTAQHMAAARESRAGALLVPEEIPESKSHQLVLDDPFEGLGRLLQWISERQRAEVPGVHPTAQVAGSARLGQRVSIGAGAVIREQVVLGDDVTIYANAYVGRRTILGGGTVVNANAVVREDVVAGERVVIHAGAVVGSDGYSFRSGPDGHQRVPQVGGVILGDDVEVGALATIDRATVDQTVIGRGTKIGDLVHVGHNCQIGSDVLLLPLTAISGSVKVGDGAIFAGRSGSADNLEIGEGARVGACAVAFKDVPAGETVWGNPARPRMEQMRIQVLLGQLGDMRSEIRTLRTELDSMKKRVETKATEKVKKMVIKKKTATKKTKTRKKAKKN